MSDVAKRELASRFWEEDERCLDDDFSLKLRGLCESEQDIMGKASIKHALIFPGGPSWPICTSSACWPCSRVAPAKGIPALRG